MTASISAKRDQIRRILQLPPPVPRGGSPSHPSLPPDAGLETDPAAREMEEAISAYLRRATENFDLSKNVEVWNNSALYRE